MANNTKTLERELEKGLKELLLDMNKEEFSEYFKQLIKKYYEVLFTFENDYSKYYEDSNKQYETTIKLVKDLTRFQYNNLDNFENLERLKQAEEIAFNQMNTIHFLETNYSDLIYSHATKEVYYINETLTSLIELYRKEPSEALLDVIEDRFTSSLTIIKEAKKLPVHEGLLSDYEETFTVKKEHFKAGRRPLEDIEETVFTVPLLSFYLPQLLEKFFKILEDLKTILPEVVINSFISELEYPEKLEFYNMLLDFGMEEEEALRLTAYEEYIKKENNTNGFLYEIINSWS